MACGTQILDPYYLGFSAIFTVLYQALFFVIAAGFKFDKVTDFAGGSNFALVVVSTLMLADTYYLRQMLVSCAVVLWAVRLSGYLLIRILKTGKDARFDTMNRGFSLEFAGFWVAQAVWVIAVSSPAVVLNSRCDSDPALGAADAAGLALFAVGFVLEAVADSDKFRFRSDPANAGRWCEEGVWGWSRHPNYAGEIILWWGLFVCVSSVLEGWLWLTLLGPITITLLILFVSGIPILEASSETRYGAAEEYQAYKRRISVLIPVPPGLYEPLPQLVKSIFFFDWPLYSKGQVAVGTSGGGYSRVD